MRTIYLTLFACCLLVSSCTPLRVVRLEPEPEQIDSYLYGNAVATVNVPSAEISTSFYDADAERVIFHVEVKNTGGQPINYDPAEATLTGPFGETLFAIDPEVELLSFDLRQLKQIRTNRALAITGAALTVAGTVAAVSTGSGGGENVTDALALGTRQQLYTDLTFAVLDATLLATIGRGSALEPSDLPPSDERDFWMQYAMRVTTIKPGEVAIGKLAFPRTLTEGTFRLATPIGEQMAEFDFVQKVYR